MGWTPKVSLGEGLALTVRASLPSTTTDTAPAASPMSQATRLTARQVRSIAVAIVGGLLAAVAAFDFA
jgi:hypothetical protein